MLNETTQPANTESETEAGTDSLARLYRFAPLDQYGFRQRLVIRLAGLLLYWLILLNGKTVRFTIVGGENDDPNRPQVVCFWHNRIPIGTWFFR
ncbi:MAG: hypothetical protein ACK562_05400, partial [Acidobacteriota bacterium]